MRNMIVQREMGAGRLLCIFLGRSTDTESTSLRRCKKGLISYTALQRRQRYHSLTPRPYWSQLGQRLPLNTFFCGGEIHVFIISNYREEGFSALTAKVIMGSFDLQDPESSGRIMS